MACARMRARSASVAPPVSTQTVCTVQPSAASLATQYDVSRPPENARASGPRLVCIVHNYAVKGEIVQGEKGGGGRWRTVEVGGGWWRLWRLWRLWRMVEV